MIVRERLVGRSVHCTIGHCYVGRMDEVAFDDLEDVLKTKPRRDTSEGKINWTGTMTHAQLHGYVRDGWPEMEQAMLGMLDQIELPAFLARPELTKKRKRRKADSGNELDIHAVYQGRSDRAWDQTYTQHLMSHGNKTAHICINLSAVNTMDFKEAMWRGALALRIYDALTRLGRSVAISAFYASEQGFTDATAFMGSCRLKAYGEPMRTDKLAGMVNLGFMRRYLMTWGIESHPTRRPSSGYGHPIDDYALHTYAAEQDHANGGSLFVIGQCFSKAQAEQALEKFVAQLLGETNIEGLNAEELMRHATLR